MAWHGIKTCYRSGSPSFLAVLLTDGAGSPRGGVHAHLSPEAMAASRRREQRLAAIVGNYSAAIQLSIPSRDLTPNSAVKYLQGLFRSVSPQVTCYTHSPFDRHRTHRLVLANVVEAFRGVGGTGPLGRVLSCPVWRDLEWLPRSLPEAVALNVSGDEHLAAALTGLYDTQIADGRRYDLGALARRRGNAVFDVSHDVQNKEAVDFALDITECCRPEGRLLRELVRSVFSELEKEVEDILE